DRALGLQLDVVDESRWNSVVADVRKRLGPVTVLHSNAADISMFARDNDLLTLDVAVWDQVFAVAARGSMLAARQVLPHMLEAGGGSIVYTSSVKGLSGSTTLFAYSAAKVSIASLA